MAHASLDHLTSEQRAVVESWGVGMAVLAGAGSGKTTTLVLKCLELLRLKSESRFIAVSFTEKSASDLQDKLSRNLRGNLTGHWVMTIHGLCGAIQREFPEAAGYDGTETLLTERESRELWARVIEELWTLEDDSAEEGSISLRQSTLVLLEREGKSSLEDLLLRVRELDAFGALESLYAADDVYSRALAQVADRCLHRYAQLKRRRGVIDFSDMERGADRALRDPQVRRFFHDRFDLVMVDEFQDTNPLQASILWRVARSDQSNLCVVGDPKQSIYRFRDADVSVFEEQCRRLSKHIGLTKNFRSKPSLLSFINTVCTPVFEASGMKYDPLVPGRVEATENSASLADEALESGTVLNLQVSSPDELAAWISSEMARGVPLHEMALLMRRVRGGAEKWLQGLVRAGIPIAVSSGGRFWEDPRVRELAAFLRWWYFPENRASAATFLRAPWVDIPDQTLDEWRLEDPTWHGPFFRSSHPVVVALRELNPLLNETFRALRPGEIILRLLFDEAREQELGAAVLGLWHRCEEWSASGLSAIDVVHEVARACEEKRREREVPPPRNLGQLTVLTVHGSKGLEFPHVILVDFSAKPQRTTPAPLLYWDRERGACLAARDEEGDRSHVESDWLRSEKEKELAECKRVFYVALTRARDRLILVTHPEPIECDPTAALTQDFWRAWIETTASDQMQVVVHVDGPKMRLVRSEHPSVSEMVSTSSESLSYPLTRARHSVTEWMVLSRCPRAYEWGFIRPRMKESLLKHQSVAPEVLEYEIEIGAEAVSEIAPSSRVSAATLGSAVHRALETRNWIELARIEKQAGPRRLSADRIRAWTEANLHLAVEADGERIEVFPELAFEFAWEGEVLVGSMDRVEVIWDADQPIRFRLIDFKVGEREKSPMDLLDQYQLQMELYALALAQLDPRSQGRLEATLVHFTPGRVAEVPIALSAPEVLSAKISDGLAVARRIWAGEPGESRPSKACYTCAFARQCDVALQKTVRTMTVDGTQAPC